MKDIKKLSKSDYVACKTQEEWDAITALAGIVWVNGKWSVYGENSVIFPTAKAYCSASWIVETGTPQGYTASEFIPTQPASKFKVGDFVRIASIGDWVYEVICVEEPLYTLKNGLKYRTSDLEAVPAPPTLPEGYKWPNGYPEYAALKPGDSIVNEDGRVGIFGLSSGVTPVRRGYKIYKMLISPSSPVKFKVGDCVKVIKKVENGCWVSSMNATVGTTSTIIDTHQKGTAKLSNGYWYPLEALELEVAVFDESHKVPASTEKLAYKYQTGDWVRVASPLPPYNNKVFKISRPISYYAIGLQYVLDSNIGTLDIWNEESLEKVSVPPEMIKGHVWPGGIPEFRVPKDNEVYIPTDSDKTCEERWIVEETEKLKVGDTVKIVRAVPDYTRSWMKEMDKLIGREGKVTYCDGCHYTLKVKGESFSYPDTSFFYPSTALEKVEEIVEKVSETPLTPLVTDVKSSERDAIQSGLVRYISAPRRSSWHEIAANSLDKAGETWVTLPYSSTDTKPNKEENPMFKVGDIVECIDTGYGGYSVPLTLGKEYTVIEVAKYGKCIEVKVMDDEGTSLFYFASRFKPQTIAEKPTVSGIKSEETSKPLPEFKAAKESLENPVEKISVGDTVECIDKGHNYRLTVGKHYVVNEMLGCGFKVTNDNNIICYYEQKLFKKVLKSPLTVPDSQVKSVESSEVQKDKESEMLKINDGDIVECINAKGGARLTEGKQYTVLSQLLKNSLHSHELKVEADNGGKLFYFAHRFKPVAQKASDPSESNPSESISQTDTNPIKEKKMLKNFIVSSLNWTLFEPLKESAKFAVRPLQYVVCYSLIGSAVLGTMYPGKVASFAKSYMPRITWEQPVSTEAAPQPEASAEVSE